MPMSSLVVAVPAAADADFVLAMNLLHISMEMESAESFVSLERASPSASDNKVRYGYGVCCSLQLVVVVVVVVVALHSPSRPLFRFRFAPF